MATIIILTFFGIVLMGLEVFLPGGVLGLIGLGCSVAATVLCFTAESVTATGMWLSFVMAACVVGVTGVVLILWLKHFQQTRLGKRFVLSSSVGGYGNQHVELVGEEAEAVSDLSPLGKIVIGGKKLAARSEAGVVMKRAKVRVVGAGGIELVVREIGGEDASEDGDAPEE